MWDAETGAPLGRPMKHEHPVKSVAFSSDDCQLITISGSGVGAKTVYVWDVSSPFPKNKRAFINRFLADPGPSFQPDLELEQTIQSHLAIGRFQYRASTATQAVARKDWFAANFHLAWLIENEPNNPRWKKLLDEVTKAESVRTKTDSDAASELKGQDGVFTTIQGRVTDVKLTIAKNSAYVFIDIGEQEKMLVWVLPVLYTKLTSTGINFSPEALQGKTISVSGTIGPYGGREERWKKYQQLSLETAEGFKIVDPKTALENQPVANTPSATPDAAPDKAPAEPSAGEPPLGTTTEPPKK